MATSRSRVNDFHSYVATNITLGNPGSGHLAEYRFATEAQSILTSGHPHHLLGKVRRNIGGPFSSKKLEVTMPTLPSTHRVYNSGGTLQRELVSVLLPHVNVASLVRNLVDMTSHDNRVLYLRDIGPAGLSEVELNGLGATAVSRFSPLNPVADTSTTIAEFLSERKLFAVPGNAGSYPGEYLNYQFGVAPTLGFAKDLRKAMRDKEKIAQQLQRDSGRWIRRRGDIYSSSDSKPFTVAAQSIPSGISPGMNSAFARGGVARATRRTSTRAWFSGAFTYFLPKEGSIWRTIAELDKKYGVKPGLNTPWELLPYSWLVDYKVNAGQVLQNLDAYLLDGLIMPYGYVMAETSEVTEYTWTGELKNSAGSWERTSLSSIVTITSKQRLHANPFGFGLKPDDLSSRQWSILAALGLSRLS